MKVYHDVVNKRIENLHKMVDNTHQDELQQIRLLVDKEISGVNNSLNNLKNQLLDHKKEINAKHSNHNTEINAKTENIFSTINRLNERVIKLESNNKDLVQQIKVLQAAIANNNGPNNDFLIDEIKELKTKLKTIDRTKPVVINTINANEPTINEKIVSTNLGLTDNDLKSISIKAKLEESENLESDYVSSKWRKSFVSGIYQSWASAQKSVNGVPNFTITLYAYNFKTKDSSLKFYQESVKEARKEETHSQEKLGMTDEGWIFEKPINTLVIKGKETEIGKAEAIFTAKTTCYNINISFIQNKLSVSDIKSMIAFLIKKL